jgi:hypothetical protein
MILDGVLEVPIIHGCCEIEHKYYRTKKNRGLIMSYKKLLFFGLCIVLLCGCHRGGASALRDDKATIQKADDHLDVDGADINGHDDPLESKVEVKVGSKGLKYSLWGGKFYRGYIDKKTKTTSYQLYVRSKNNQLMNWDIARYLTQEGLIEVPVVRIGKEVTCTQYGCSYFEDVILNVDRATLEKWNSANITVRFSSSTVSGNNDIDIDKDDTITFIKAMDTVIAYYSKQATKYKYYSSK